MTLKQDITSDEETFFNLDELAVRALYKYASGATFSCNVVIEENQVSIVEQGYGENKKFEATILIPSDKAKEIGKIKKDERIYIVDTGIEWTIDSVLSSDEIGVLVFCVRNNIYKVKNT